MLIIACLIQLKFTYSYLNRMPGIVNFRKWTVFLLVSMLLGRCGECFKLQYPISFGLIRFASPNVPYETFMKQIGKPEISNETLLNEGYNVVSLAGFTDSTIYTSIESTLSPLSIWKRIYEIIMGNKPNLMGATDQEIRDYVINNQFHAQGAKLLMNVDLTQSPVSRKVDATQLGKEIVSSASQLSFDGVSLDFKDYHSVKDNFASDWLEALLQSIRANSKGEEFIVVLIVPSTFPLSVRLFKIPLINALVDYFVLQYYGASQVDYTSYSSLFTTAAVYTGTALFEYLNNAEIVFDVCRTIIAKPVTNDNPSQYINPQSMASLMMQAYNEIGWFGGIANLEHGPNTPSFANIALQSLRDQCSKDEKCVC